MKKTCEICGKPSGMYPLCTDCFKLRDAGKVVKCDECGTWHKINEPCKCKPNVKKADTEKIKIKDTEKIEKNSHKETTECIICGKESYGYLFCKECYDKYSNKTILIKITNCRETEFCQILDNHEEGLIYKCEDGHKVRSKSEMLIDNWLFTHGFAHAYEKAVPVDADPNHDMHPDFYLSKEDIYIEHWGYENAKDYKKQKEYKIDIYNQQGKTVVTTTETDLGDINSTLERKLKFYVKGKVNE